MSSSLSIGLDIGGTKIAGAAFNARGEMLHQETVPTPKEYKAFLSACEGIVTLLEMRTETVDRIGVSIAGMIDQEKGSVHSVALTCVRDKPLRDDLSATMSRAVRIANDGECIALAEAIDGAGYGYQTVLGLTIGTGIGSGFVINGHLLSGPNGLVGEIGHLPLPYREDADGVRIECGCGQKGCIETMIAGSALMRLYTEMTGKVADNPQIATFSRAGDVETLAVLDRYYEMVAKAMVTIIHSFDPEVIVVSGGLNSLPGLYEAVPAKWGKYCLAKNPKTLFLPAKHGAIAGLRGAAGLWNDRLFEA